MGQLIRSSLWILAGFALPVGLAGIAYAIARAGGLPQTSANREPATAANPTKVCQTIIADPNPPANVRSSPVVAPDNTLRTLPNGSPITIADENDGWLRISQPMEGWIYKELTVTSCGSPLEHTRLKTPTANNGTSNGTSDDAAKLFAIATEQYQAGNINGAIALAKTIPADSPTHQPAELAAAQWQKDWSRAESEYYIARKSMQDGKWQDILSQVKTFPDNRYWKEKLAPIVQAAMKQNVPQTTP